MAMGRRKKQQAQMFLPTARGGGHRFYEALSKLLDEVRFDESVESLCAKHYADDDKPGRPSIAPGLYFRMLLIGYFEGIGSERGIAWRCADSMSLREFLNLPSHVPVPDSSTVSRTRRRLPPDVFQSVFQLVLAIVEEKGLFRGKVRGVDSTYLQADASMRSIVRKDTGEDYREYIKRVTAEDTSHPTTPGPVPSAQAMPTATSDTDRAPGDATPSEDSTAAATVATAVLAAADDDNGNDVEAKCNEAEITAPSQRPVSAEEAVRHDRKRAKSTSNKDWKSPTDVDATIARMKNGTTRLAYKAEHVVDMETGAILAAEVFKGNEHDTATLETSLGAAEKNLGAIGRGASSEENAGEPWHQQPIAEVVADKGYHKASLLLALLLLGYRTFIPEKKQHGERTFADKGGDAARKAFHANRARTKREKGKNHQRRRGEILERPNQHLYDRGDLRNLTVTGQLNVQKRVLAQAAAFNLGLVMRKMLGAGTPRWLAAAFAAAVLTLLRVAVRVATAYDICPSPSWWRAPVLHAAAHR
jgi:transposase